jgi:hypothetical protein
LPFNARIFLMFHRLADIGAWDATARQLTPRETV